MSAGHANAAVRFGAELVLKVFRKLEDGMSPELETGRVLAPRAPTLVAPIRGALEYVPTSTRAERATVAVVQGFVANEGTAWEHARAELRRFYERALTRRDELPPATDAPLLELAEGPVPALLRDTMGPYLDMASLMGKRTAELHHALAACDGPAFAPEPYTSFDQRSLYQSLRNLTGRTLRALKPRVPRLPAEAQSDAHAVIQAERALLDRFMPLVAESITSVRIRCHGDYHLGQLLYTGKDFVVIDFDGGPGKPLSERRRKRSPLRDVASMARSFHHAAFVALGDAGVVREADRALLLPWADAWQAFSSAAFVRAYLAAAGAADFLPPSPKQAGILLDAFLLAKALHELEDELNEPRHTVSITLRALVRATRSS
jgi:maltose alpha-D-glucosyltransferase/alpha-amylase